MKEQEKSDAVWYLIRTKRGQEFLAQHALTRVAKETFLPVLRTRRRGKFDNAPAPLFPNHLFARLDPTKTRLAVKYCAGVRELVLDGDAPVLIPTQIVEFLKQRATSQEEAQLVEPGKEIAAEMETLFLQSLSTEERLMVLFKAIKGGARTLRLGI
jgi:transcription antitermination factor NusG